MQQHSNHKNTRGEEKEQGIEKLFEKIMTENFLNLDREKAIQVQEAQSPNQDEPT